MFYVCTETAPKSLEIYQRFFLRHCRVFFFLVLPAEEGAEEEDARKKL